MFSLCLRGLSAFLPQSRLIGDFELAVGVNVRAIVCLSKSAQRWTGDIFIRLCASETDTRGSWKNLLSDNHRWKHVSKLHQKSLHLLKLSESGSTCDELPLSSDTDIVSWGACEKRMSHYSESHLLTLSSLNRLAPPEKFFHQHKNVNTLECQHSRQ